MSRGLFRKTSFNKMVGAYRSQWKRFWLRLFTFKLFKLFVALFVAIDNIKYDNELEKLQRANQELKQQVREVMAQSGDVSQVLREKDLDAIEKVLREYDESICSAMQCVESAVNVLGVEIGQNIGR